LGFAGIANLFAGPLDVAIALLERARRLSPAADGSNDQVLTALACARHLEGDHTTALELATQSLVSHATWSWTWMTIAGAAAALGQPERAREALAQVERTQPGFTLSHRIFDVFSDRPRCEALKAHMRQAGVAD
jgi:tetratricopeptide (TPR) repeat protein